MPVRESPREKGRALGRWANGGEDGRVQMTGAPTRGAL